MNRCLINFLYLGRSLLYLGCILLLFVFAAPAAWAHPLNNGYSQISIDRKDIQYELTLPEADLLMFDTDKDNVLSEEELNLRRPAIETYLRSGLHMELPSGPLDFSLLSMEKTEKTGVPAVSFLLAFHSKSPVDSLNIRYNLLFDDADPAHVNFLVITNGDDVDQTVFDSANRSYHYQAMRQAGMLSSAWEYFTLGIEHILTGYDHLLFLLALIIAAARLKDVVKIVTAFTVAHSITLFLAATGRIHIESRWIEAGIALTIAYAAIENLYIRSVNIRWVLTFLFGLVHGMGFAGAISEVGLPEQYLISSLLSFNLGVEAGQLAVVLIVLPFLLKMRQWKFYRTGVKTASILFALIAVYWFFERIR